MMTRRGFFGVLAWVPLLTRFQPSIQPQGLPQQRLIDEAGRCIEIPKGKYILVSRVQEYNVRSARPRLHETRRYIGRTTDGWTIEVLVFDGCIREVRRHR